ncbi:hypothetical protein [Streptomyces sp. NPDC059071]|uniref:hypothetical protein n=1 Tax=unclassified Streptomyces TaxID=2593676 RepID=UPI00362CF1AA
MNSVATARRSVRDPAVSPPLLPPLTAGDPVASTDAYAIDCEISGYRAVVALRETGGTARTVTDRQMA